MKKKTKVTIAVVFVIVLLLLILALLLGLDALKMKREASALKADIVSLATYVKNEDYENATKTLDKANTAAKVIDDKLNSPLWFWFSSGKNLIKAWNIASEKLISPGLDLLQNYPIEDLKVDDGFNITIANKYLDFVMDSSEDIAIIIRCLDNISPLVSSKTGLDKYLTKLDDALDLYEEGYQYLPLIKAFLGNGEDKTYLFLAQNSAEIRALGGFPGSASVIRIKNGILTIDDFKAISNLLPFISPSECNFTTEELIMSDNRIYHNKDAEYIPDFSRAADVWATGYKSMHGVDLDGVISATPHIVQRLLSFLGSVTLSDGRTIDGSNALKVIEKDIYFDYFAKNKTIKNAGTKTDDLFSEAAKKTMDLALSSISIAHATDYLNLLKVSFENREIMLWFADESSQAEAIKANCSGILNNDPTKPETGVFYSCCHAGKLGIFVSIDYNISEPKLNEDGTKSYDVTLNIGNTMKLGETKDIPTYVIGADKGQICSFILLNAPCEGKITDVKATNGMSFSNLTYKNLQFEYALNFFIDPEETVEITYTVTTSSKATDDLRLVRTPTLAEYIN